MMLLSLPGFKGSRDGVLGSPPSSSVPRGPQMGFHSTQHHECHAQLWSKPFLEGQCDNIKVASKVLPKTTCRATSTAVPNPQNPQPVSPHPQSILPSIGKQRTQENSPLKEIYPAPTLPSQNTSEQSLQPQGVCTFILLCSFIQST